MIHKFTEKEKNQQIKKEALISLALYCLFFVWWYFTGYGLSGENPSQYNYIFGLPMWFFLSSVVGYILFCMAVIIVVKLFFKNFDLGNEVSDDNIEEV